MRADEQIVNERPGHGHARNQERVNTRAHPTENDRERCIDRQANCVHQPQAAPIESAFDHFPPQFAGPLEEERHRHDVEQRCDG